CCKRSKHESPCFSLATRSDVRRNKSAALWFGGMFWIGKPGCHTMHRERTPHSFWKGRNIVDCTIACCGTGNRRGQFSRRFRTERAFCLQCPCIPWSKIWLLRGPEVCKKSCCKP